VHAEVFCGERKHGSRPAVDRNRYKKFFKTKKVFAIDPANWEYLPSDSAAHGAAAYMLGQRCLRTLE